MVASTRGNPDIGDIVRTVVVMGVILLGLWGVGKFFTSSPEQTVPTVDYRQVIEQAQPSTDLGLLAPDPLPDGWRATSARFAPGDDGGTWHLGILTDDEEYVGIEQTPLTARRAIDRWAKNSEAAGSTQIEDQVWTVRAGPGDRLAYVNRDGDRTTLVTGTIAQAELERYIESLTSVAAG